MDENKIILKRPKRKVISQEEKYAINFEKWVAYWRANPHRFITDYLGLKLYDFQKVLLYMMNFYPNFIYTASRGLAKSTLALLFAIGKAILYPNISILIVCPVKSQSRNFIKKVEEFVRVSPNLAAEIMDIKTGINECSIKFKNGSTIFTAPYSENSLGIRTQVLIVDEYVRTEKEVLTRVFLPMLSNTRQPPYKSLTVQERLDLPEEKNKQLYLSSIRGADEWSYKEFEAYVDYMLKGDTNYITVALPYHFGVKNRYINRDIVEQEFRNNKDSLPMVRAEFLAIPERGNEDAFFKYDMLEKARDNVKALYAMSDEEYIVYRNRKNEWKFYVEKLSNEIRILSMDVALLESAQNDNTSFWITRLIPDGTSYKKLVAYGESMHGLNSIIQMKRAKQLFYEMECDYFVLDTQGVGMSIFDLSTTPTYDEVRDVTYPAWTVLNPDDVKMSNRTIDPDAVPLIYSVKTPIQLKSEMFLNMRNMLSSGKVSLLSETQEAIDYMTPIYKFYKIEDSDLRVRLLNPYVQTNLLINEAVNLEQVATQGYINLKEKAGRRKDRVMSLAYNLYYTKLLEDANRNQSDDNLLDYVMFV